MLRFDRKQNSVKRVLPFPPPGDLPNPVIELGSPVLTDRFLLSEPPGKPSSRMTECKWENIYLLNTATCSEVFIAVL